MVADNGGRRLRIWMASGAALDCLVLTGIWLLLDAIGPLQSMAEYWLEAIGLVAVPWMVHVVALPALLRGVRINWELVARSLAFIGLAAYLIPFAGIFAFLLVVGPPVALIETALKGGGAHNAIGAQLDWIDKLTDDIGWTLVATLVGAVMGFMLNLLRPDAMVASPRSDHPRLRSDVLGGVSGAFLVFSGIFAAAALGALDRPMAGTNDWMSNLAQVPRLPAILVIGVLALLPHLYWVGRDIFPPVSSGNGEPERR